MRLLPAGTAALLAILLFMRAADATEVVCVPLPGRAGHGDAGVGGLSLPAAPDSPLGQLAAFSCPLSPWPAASQVKLTWRAQAGQHWAAVDAPAPLDERFFHAAVVRASPSDLSFPLLFYCNLLCARLCRRWSRAGSCPSNIAMLLASAFCPCRCHSAGGRGMAPLRASLH